MAILMSSLDHHPLGAGLAKTHSRTHSHGPGGAIVGGKINRDTRARAEARTERFVNISTE